MRRAQSDHALAVNAQGRLHRCPAYYPVPVRRVQSQPCFHHRARQQSQRQDVRASAPAPRPACVAPHVSTRNVTGVPSVAAEGEARSRDANKSTVEGIESRRAIWEFE